jgi:flagellar hook-length control protein FliK
MNAAEVLSTLSVDSGKYASGQKQSESSQIDGTLFAMLLGSLLPNQGNVEEQSEDIQEGALAGGALVNNAYFQYLQNISPAGMEADSGKISQNSVSDYLKMLMGELSLESTQFQGISENNKQIIGDSDFLVRLLDAVKTGNVATGSFEGTSLDSSELEKYIGILNQVEELSGKLELKNVKTDNQPGFSVFQTETLKTVREPQQSGDSLANKEENSGDSSAKDGTRTADKMPNDLIAGLNNNQTVNNNQIFTNGVLSAFHNPNKIWAQVLDAVRNSKGSGSKEINEISLQLQPEELGKLHVSMKMENGQLHMIINASEQATGAFIQNHMAELKESLSQAGIECSMMQMGLSSENERDQNWNYNPNNSRQYQFAEEQESAKALSMVGYGIPVVSSDQGSINISV